MKYDKLVTKLISEMSPKLSTGNAISYEVEKTPEVTKWRVGGKKHREDGPAIEWADDRRSWFINGKRHREDGPAIEGHDGENYWFINGVELTEEEFNARRR